MGAEAVLLGRVLCMLEWRRKTGMGVPAVLPGVLSARWNGGGKRQWALRFVAGLLFDRH